MLVFSFTARANWQGRNHKIFETMQSMGSDSIDFMIIRLYTATTIKTEVDHGTLTQICYSRQLATCHY